MPNQDLELFHLATANWNIGEISETKHLLSQIHRNNLPESTHSEFSQMQLNSTKVLSLMEAATTSSSEKLAIEILRNAFKYMPPSAHHSAEFSQSLCAYHWRYVQQERNHSWEIGMSFTRTAIDSLEMIVACNSTQLEKKNQGAGQCAVTVGFLETRNLIGAVKAFRNCPSTNPTFVDVARTLVIFQQLETGITEGLFSIVCFELEMESKSCAEACCSAIVHYATLPGDLVNVIDSVLKLNVEGILQNILSLISDAPVINRIQEAATYPRRVHWLISRCEYLVALSEVEAALVSAQALAGVKNKFPEFLPQIEDLLMIIKRIQECRTLLKEKKYQEALKIAEAEIPRSLPFQFLKAALMGIQGKCLCNLGKREEAIEILTESTILASTVKAYESLGDCYMQINASHKAVTAYTLAMNMVKTRNDQSFSLQKKILRKLEAAQSQQTSTRAVFTEKEQDVECSSIFRDKTETQLRQLFGLGSAKYKCADVKKGFRIHSKIHHPDKASAAEKFCAARNFRDLSYVHDYFMANCEK